MLYCADYRLAMIFVASSTASGPPSPTGEGIRAQRGVREKRVRKSNFMNKTLFYK